jgi:hypothetical protein
MRRLLGLVVRIYPTEWRRRYGEELSSLLHDAELSPSDVIDLMGWALRRRLESAIRLVPTRSPGGVMFQHANSHPARYALTGLAVLLPTATFIALALMKYVLGISGPFDAVEPTVTPFITDPAGETVLIVAPYVALLLAAIPIVRVRLAWHDMRLTGGIEVAAPALNLIVVVVSAAVVVFMAIYWVAENL